MAHSCPDCDQLCHCGGDIDDCELDLQPTEGCSHGCWDQEEDRREEEEELEHLRSQRVAEDPPA